MSAFNVTFEMRGAQTIAYVRFYDGERRTGERCTSHSASWLHLAKVESNHPLILISSDWEPLDSFQYVGWWAFMVRLAKLLEINCYRFS